MGSSALPIRCLCDECKNAYREISPVLLRCVPLDYNRLKEAMIPLEYLLRKTDMIRLKGEGTDITFSVKDQNWIPCYGKRNIPDGELFSSPILDSVNGHITYAPSVYQGKPFEFVKLEVKNGTVTDFNSSDNAALEEIL